MGTKGAVPWKRIILASGMTILTIFLLTLAVSLLTSYYILELKIAGYFMFAVLFVGGFIGCFAINKCDKRILWTVSAAILSFILLIAMGMTTAHPFSSRFTMIIFVILLVSAITNSIVRAMFK